MSDLSPSSQPLPRRAQHNSFARERRVRFLDQLALTGTVGAAAAAAGITRETAYRARRQDAAFAGLWDAALVHARVCAENELGARAFEGVEVPIVHQGEVTGHRVHHDPRWLLAHLARLDLRLEHDGDAVARAGRFDELLADYAGHPAPDGFFAAAREAIDWRERDEDAPELPPTREEWVAHRRSEAAGAGSGPDETERVAEATLAGGAEWDAWHAGAADRVAALVFGEPRAEREGENGPGAAARPDEASPDGEAASRAGA